MVHVGCVASFVLPLMAAFGCVVAQGQSRYVYDLSNTHKQTLLNRHNQVRASVQASNMQEMVWDGALEQSAKAYALRCSADHSTTATRSNIGSFSYVGENLWWTSSFSFPSMDMAVQMLFDEYPYYDYNTGACQWGQMCGHYTQVAWATSCAVGCAVSVCDRLANGRGINSGTLLVCHYGPGGNAQGIKPFALGPRCSQCPGGGGCVNGLCASQCSRGGGITSSWTQTNQVAVIPAQPFVPPPPPSGCADLDGNCAMWASKGECGANPTYMLYKCRRSCNADNCAGTNSNTGNQIQFAAIGNSACANENEVLCRFWASSQECGRNPTYMMNHCRKACSPCVADAPAYYGPCQDQSSNCGMWAATGECDRNGFYMDLNCRRSCKRC